LNFLEKYGVSLHLRCSIFTKRITVHWGISNEQYYDLVNTLFGYSYRGSRSKSDVKSIISKINFVIESDRDDLRVPFSTDSFTQLTVYKNESYFYNVYEKEEVIEDFDYLEDTYDRKGVTPEMIIPTEDILGMLIDLDYFYNNVMVEYENVV